MQADGIYRALLHCYPAAFRQEYGDEMRLLFTDQLVDARRRGSWVDESTLWLRAAVDALTVAPKEHWHVILQDIRYALRMLAASPGFSLVAILSLALGIGASTGIFGLWNGMVHSSLPVQQPEQLVILSNPDAAGVSIGSESGERSLLTYTEFEQLRDRTDAFTSLMASQSNLDSWQIRFETGDFEEAKGRMVSEGFFDLLGATPAMGRLFNTRDDAGAAPYAVISHEYWMRRFGGRSDIIGKPITVRKAALTILGVTRPGFTGETVGQHPDLWVPLRMQPQVLLGRDWLHDQGTEKVMWLHVFGRLKSGVSLAQADASANAVFKQALETYYGPIAAPDTRREFMDQRLKLRPANRGASTVRGNIADPLATLLAAVGVVLLIACANLANLLLARGAARYREIALRLSLGASRARLVRQLLTESMVLAVAGGAGGIAAAYGIHVVLVRLVSRAQQDFSMGFRLDGPVLLFCLAVTFGAALVFGVLPAWLGTNAQESAALKSEGRSTTGSARQLRWGRWLVAFQLALSLPLLVVAGLLLRTLYNLQHTDLGYAQEKLLVVGRVDAQSAGYAELRRDPLFREILTRIRQIPGVTAASYSENGLFSGRNSGDQVEVEGYTPKGKDPEGAAWDQAGPGYFTALGVPLLLGRDFNENDHAGAPKVCIVNEAFAKKFFAGRNPIGMHITTIYGERRITHQVVGVAKDMRTHSLRRDPPPRNFVPLSQPLGEVDGVEFVVRTATDSRAVFESIRKIIQQTDASLPIGKMVTIGERIDGRTAQDQTMARLALAFGVAALLLAAIGLYGVLSYAVTRRRGEIGIRIALGAKPAQVSGMILRETAGVLVAGLVLGAGLAYGASRLIESQIYGLAPHDPATLLVAVLALVAVSLTAAYLPANRASRLDPMVALRQE